MKSGILCVLLFSTQRERETVFMSAAVLSALSSLSEQSAEQRGEEKKAGRDGKKISNVWFLNNRNK